MESYCFTDIYTWVVDGKAPLTDLVRFIEDRWEAELTDFASDPYPAHLFCSLVAIANWLNLDPGWSPDDYVTNWQSGSRDGWRASVRVDVGFGLEPGIDVFQAEPYQPEAECAPASFWGYEGNFQYRLEGHNYNVVLLGWDNRRHTFTAEVWEVEPYELLSQGKFVCRIGRSLTKYADALALAVALREYAFVPRDLRERLNADRDRAGEVENER